MLTAPLTLLALALPLVAAAPAVEVRQTFPHDPNADPRCTLFADNDGSLSLARFAQSWGVLFRDVIHWNPSLTAEGGNFITGQSYCVKVSS
ncbi:hypothetical protein Micbo1qcDRAFT_208989 [Microdochium bolleyi]|uniref:LysM domain-containing protein n=1 Tax=Microdochium bolleyi TaxID=196109 RepID=A0A136INR3_9PEZI|nr:hypothetical protein Micbo1qcDRAFT_208989 [Microdochium bolleyi]